MSRPNADLPIKRSISITIIQGERRVARSQNVVLATLLGSCVAACLWDEVAQIGGMNHFLLPNQGAQSVNYGVHAMELLINDLLIAGASRMRMQAKLFGGARIRHGLTDIGEQNATFAEQFLANEGVALVGSSLRGERGRRVQFWPMTGRARQIYLEPSEPALIVQPPTEVGGNLEMF